jgi:hypothetical protein
MFYFIFGFLCFNIGTNTIKTVYKTEKVLVSDEMNKCIEKGGQFALFYSDFEEKYVINCEIPEKKIFRKTF